MIEVILQCALVCVVAIGAYIVGYKHCTRHIQAHARRLANQNRARKEAAIRTVPARHADEEAAAGIPQSAIRNPQSQVSP